MATVLGIDFGNENCAIAAAHLSVETRTIVYTAVNDINLETLGADIDGHSASAAFPSVVQFMTWNRIFGSAAKLGWRANAANTVFGFKRLLGKNFEDASVSQIAETSPFQIDSLQEGTCGVTLSYLFTRHRFSIEHISGMLLRKLAQAACLALSEKVTDCVVSVPSYFTDAERRSLLTACELTGLNIMQVFDETSAAALSYAHQLENDIDESVRRNVVFVDCGHSALQVFACSFHRGKFRILSAISDPNLGGRDINEVLTQYFALEYKEATGFELLTDRKIYWELMEEVEVIKKYLSTHSTAKKILNLPMINETRGGAFEMQISRPELEQLCTQLFSRIEGSLRKCLAGSGLELSEIHSVEILGGTTKIPGVQDVISKVFGKKCSTTLNSEDAIARGCALQCAINLPNFNGPTYSPSSVLLYPISLSWEMETSEITLLEIFHKNQEFPCTTSVTMSHASPPLTFHVVYSSSGPTQNIGVYTVRRNHSSPQCQQSSEQLSEIHVKIRINSNGILEVVHAKCTKYGDTIEGLGQPQLYAVESSPNESSVPKPMTELHIHSKEPGHVRKLEQLFELEEKLVAYDFQEEERLEAKTALEKYLNSLKTRFDGRPEKHTHEVKELLEKIGLTQNWMAELDGEFPIQKYSYTERQLELQDMVEAMDKLHM